MGIGMIAAAWVLVLGLLTALLGYWQESQYDPNGMLEGQTLRSGVREVQLKQNREGHYVARGKINGAPVRFLLDTGATDVSIPSGLAGELGLERGPAQSVRTAAGIITTYATRLDRVSLGSIELRDLRAHINPHMRSGEVLLGMSFLKNLELVQQRGLLTLRQHPIGS